MKKLSLLISFLLMLALFGCNNAPNYQTPVKFYYPKNQPSYGKPDASIGFELSEGQGLTTEQLLQTYLLGASDLTLYDPFPDNVTLISLKEKDLMVTVMLSNEFAALSGIDATLACICLARTTMELTDADTIAITCESAMIDGEQTLHFSKEEILWLDESIGGPATTETN